MKDGIIARARNYVRRLPTSPDHKLLSGSQRRAVGGRMKSSAPSSRPEAPDTSRRNRNAISPPLAALAPRHCSREGRVRQNVIHPIGRREAATATTPRLESHTLDWHQREPRKLLKLIAELGYEKSGNIPVVRHAADMKKPSHDFTNVLRNLLGHTPPEVAEVETIQE